jgi:serine/threonine-protein kinase HipA
MNRCPLTYEPLVEGAYSLRGLRRLSPRLSELRPLPYSAADQLREAALRADKMSIQGVQPKLSARLVPARGAFEVVDRGGTFILKPRHPIYAHLPENEDLTMRLAAAAGIDVPLHGMVWSRDASLTYFIRRFDRRGRGERLAVEDFAQLTGGSRDTKYDSSMERLVAVLDAHCTFPALARRELFRRSLFCFLVGNEDMHLKNWSLLTLAGQTALSPAYDLVSSTLVLGASAEEVALPLRGRTRNLTRKDWLDYWARDRLALTDRSIQGVLDAFAAAVPAWHELLGRSFLPTSLREGYREILGERLRRVGLA